MIHALLFVVIANLVKKEIYTLLSSFGIATSVHSSQISFDFAKITAAQMYSAHLTDLALRAKQSRYIHHIILYITHYHCKKTYTTKSINILLQTDFLFVCLFFSSDHISVGKSTASPKGNC